MWYIITLIYIFVGVLVFLSTKTDKPKDMSLYGGKYKEDFAYAIITGVFWPIVLFIKLH